MDLKFAQKISELLHLGWVVSEPLRMLGGLLHELWQLETSQGLFAIKVLNKNILTSDYITQLNITENIARQFAHQQIPAVCAVPHEQQVVIAIDNVNIMVYPWVTGHVLQLDEITPTHADQIGQITAKMHKAVIDVPNAPALHMHHFTYEDWSGLIEQGQRAGVQWGEELHRVAAQLGGFSEQAMAAKLLSEPVISHRDLHVKNVLWQEVEGQPAIIDWEYAGWTDPGMDLLGTALNWAFVTKGTVDKELFQAILRGYRAINPVLPRVNHATIASFIGFCLDWLAFNMQRSLEPSSWQAIANEEVMTTWVAVQTTSQGAEKWLEWYGEE